MLKIHKSFYYKQTEFSLEIGVEGTVPKVVIMVDKFGVIEEKNRDASVTGGAGVGLRVGQRVYCPDGSMFTA